MSITPVEMPCQFTDAPEAHSLQDAQNLAIAAIGAKITSFVIRKAHWQRITRHHPEAVIFKPALGGAVLRRDVRYSFSGRQPRHAHVDEVAENLLELPHHGMFNVHHVVFGAITACMVHTRPGYYTQDTFNRVPNTAYNPGITEDILRRQLINTYTTDVNITEARLTAGDRIIFFERASATINGAPNVVHLFHRGTPDRLSIIDQYYTTAQGSISATREY